MLYGYARVSTQEQETRAQLDALNRAGVERVYQEKRSGGTLRRPVLEALLTSLQPGDVVVVYKLDRIARSLVDLLHILARIKAAGAQFRSQTEIIDTHSPAGRMMTHILGAFGEFERDLIRERTRAGLQAAKERGAPIGRPRSMTAEDEASAVRRWLARNESPVTLSQLARDYGCHLSSIKRAIGRAGVWEVSRPQRKEQQQKRSKRQTERDASNKSIARTLGRSRRHGDTAARNEDHAGSILQAEFL